MQSQARVELKLKEIVQDNGNISQEAWLVSKHILQFRSSKNLPACYRQKITANKTAIAPDIQEKIQFLNTILFNDYPELGELMLKREDYRWNWRPIEAESGILAWAQIQFNPDNLYDKNTKESLAQRVAEVFYELKSKFQMETLVHGDAEVKSEPEQRLLPVMYGETLGNNTWLIMLPHLDKLTLADLKVVADACQYNWLRQSHFLAPAVIFQQRTTYVGAQGLFAAAAASSLTQSKEATTVINAKAEFPNIAPKGTCVNFHSAITGSNFSLNGVNDIFLDFLNHYKFPHIYYTQAVGISFLRKEISIVARDLLVSPNQANENILLIGGVERQHVPVFRNFAASVDQLNLSTGLPFLLRRDKKLGLFYASTDVQNFPSSRAIKKLIQHNKIKVQGGVVNKDNNKFINVIALNNNEVRFYFPQEPVLDPLIVDTLATIRANNSTSPTQENVQMKESMKRTV